MRLYPIGKFNKYKKDTEMFISEAYAQGVGGGNGGLMGLLPFVLIYCAKNLEGIMITMVVENYCGTAMR